MQLLLIRTFKSDLTFNPGSLVTVTSLTNDAFEKAYDGIDQVGTVTADKIEGFNQNAVVTPDYALVDHKVTLEGNTLTGILTKSDKTLADYALGCGGQRSNGRQQSFRRAGGFDKS